MDGGNASASHPSNELDFLTSAVQIPPSVSNKKHDPYSEHVERVSLGSTCLDDGQYQNTLTSVDSHLSPRNLCAPSAGISDFATVVQDSKHAGEVERHMTIREGLRTYPKAIFWSVMLSMTLVMEGYDLNIVNGLFALPQFQQRYGEYIGDGDWSISRVWQSALTTGAVAGEIIGLFFNGHFTEKYGHRRCLMVALVWLCLCVSLAFFASHIQMLLVSEILCGLSWGVFQTLSCTYAAEVMPVALRAYLTANVNLCWLFGQLVGSGVLRGTFQWRNQWSYRVPFGLQWMWAAPILVASCFAPESPWWLVRKGRIDDAKKNLRRLTSQKHPINEHETINMMRHTNEVEKSITAGTSYTDCFRGIDLRRTEIVCMVWIIQVLTGSPMTGYAAYFFTRAGLPPARAYDLAIGMYGVAICAHVIALFLMARLGRRQLYISGCLLMGLTLLTAGIVASVPRSNGQGWTLGALIVFMTFIYDASIGPVCYSLVSELSSTRLRIKAVVLARVAYNLVSIVSNILMPFMLNPESWNLRGKTCYVWASTALLCTAWCYFRLPEPKGLTYLEIDIFFQRKVPARKFNRLQVNLSDSGYFSLVETTTDRRGWAGYK